MKVVSFSKQFKMTLPFGRGELKVHKNNKYVFSDFVIKQFLENVMKNSNGMVKNADDIIKSMEEITNVFPVIDLSQPIEELKKTKALIIVRTGGIGDLIALSNVVNLVGHIFRDVLENKSFKVFFITDSKYSPIFKYFKPMIKTIYYFHNPVDKILRDNGIYGFNGVRSVFFEGLIEDREDNWFDLQVDRLNLKKFQLYDKINKDYLVLNPKLKDKYDCWRGAELTVKKKYDINIVSTFDKYKSDDIKTILLHHRASAWIRTFNLGDVIVTLNEYFKKHNISNYKLITLERNFSKTDIDFFKNSDNSDEISHVNPIATKNLHEFFYIISKSDYVISSDTAAFHFREGMGEPAIGLYSSFPCRMRTATYVNTSSYDIIFKDCEYVSNPDTYYGCISHFKTPYELCVYTANRYKEYLTSKHHFIRGNRIPDNSFVTELNQFVEKVGMDKLLEEEIFQYAPCLSSRWNPLFKKQLLKIYEKEDIIGRMKNN